MYLPQIEKQKHQHPQTHRKLWRSMFGHSTKTVSVVQKSRKNDFTTRPIITVETIPKSDIIVINASEKLVGLGEPD